MSNNDLVTILKAKEPMNRIAMALGFSDAEEDESGRREAEKYMSSVVATVSSNPKLMICTPKSIMYAAIDAAKLKIAIDGRGLAALIPYGKEAKLQITSAGYESKLHENLKNSNIVTGVVYDGDSFELESMDGFDRYKHVVANPFQENINKLQGIYVAISYTKAGRDYQIVCMLSKNELNKIKSTAKSSAVWNKWFIERAKTAAIKRACKRLFNDVMGLQDMIDYDNNVHHKIELDSRSENNLVDNLNNRIKNVEKEQTHGEKKQKEDKRIKTNIIDVEPEPEPQEQEDEQDIDSVFDN